jgi:predicted  nucleic acid-binding Zn-ribbon protein
MKPVSNITPSSVDENREAEASERTQHDIHQTRREFDDHVEKCRTGFRGVRALWVVVILIVLGLGGSSWYASRSIGGYKSLWDAIPDLRTSASAMGDHLNSIEGTISDLSSNRTSMSERMDRFEKTLGSGLKAARSESQTAANQIGRRIHEEIDQSLQRLQSRVNNVETVQRENHDQLAAAQAEIGSLRQQMAGMQQQNDERLINLQQTTQSNVNRINGKVASIDDQVMAHTASLNALNEQVEREPVTFELSNSRTTQVTPGVYLTINHTDVAHQKVDGWMQLVEEGRIIWIRDLGAQHVMTFVTRSDDRAYELVFTGVQQNGATGYVLVPHHQTISSAN